MRRLWRFWSDSSQRQFAEICELREIEIAMDGPYSYWVPEEAEDLAREWGATEDTSDA